MKATYPFLLTLFLASACASGPTIMVSEKLQYGASVGVIPFRDCLIASQEDDCPGSGGVAGPVYAQVLSSKSGLKVDILSRPVPPTSELTDEAALAAGRSRGVDFVLTGEVNDFYSVAPMTYRSDKAAVTVRLIRVSDGHVVASQTESVSGGNFSTPAGLIRKVAVKLRDRL